jgi:arginine decarboxylase-like protein
MKKILSTGIFLAVAFVVSVSFAQMGGQMKGQDMMGNMTNVMQEMSGMMENLAHPMGHITIADHQKMNNMAKIMRDMAIEMNKMASHMEKGEMDSSTVKKMQDRIKVNNDSIEALRKKNQ